MEKKSCTTQVVRKAGFISVPWTSTSIKIMVFPQFRWFKPLGFSNGGYIIILTPIVLMVAGLSGSCHTVDGGNPALVDIINIPSFRGFYASQVVQDLFHQQYCPWVVHDFFLLRFIFPGLHVPQTNSPPHLHDRLTPRDRRCRDAWPRKKSVEVNSVVYLPIHLVDFYCKCREIYNTWIVWVSPQFWMIKIPYILKDSVWWKRIL